MWSLTKYCQHTWICIIPTCHLRKGLCYFISTVLILCAVRNVLINCDLEWKARQQTFFFKVVDVERGSTGFSALGCDCHFQKCSLCSAPPPETFALLCYLCSVAPMRCSVPVAASVSHDLICIQVLAELIAVYYQTNLMTKSNIQDPSDLGRHQEKLKFLWCSLSQKFHSSLIPLLCMAFLILGFF